MAERVSPYLERPLRTLEQALEARARTVDATSDAAPSDTADTAAALVRWLQGGTHATPDAKPDRPQDPALLPGRRAA